MKILPNPLAKNHSIRSATGAIYVEHTFAQANGRLTVTNSLARKNGGAVHLGAPPGGSFEMLSVAWAGFDAVVGLL